MAIMIALVTVTVMYVATALVAVAAQPADKFKEQEAGLAAILQDVVGASWPGTVLAAGAIISIFSVTLVVLYGQTRILFAMSRDGLVPSVFRKVNPRTITPVRNTVIVAVAVAVLAGLIPIDLLSEMTSIGNPGGLHRGFHRSDRAASHRAGPAQGVQGAGVPGHPGAVRDRLRHHHYEPGDDHHRGVPDVDRSGVDLVPSPGEDVIPSWASRKGLRAHTEGPS